MDHYKRKFLSNFSITSGKGLQRGKAASYKIALEIFFAEVFLKAAIKIQQGIAYQMQTRVTIK